MRAVGMLVVGALFLFTLYFGLRGVLLHFYRFDILGPLLIGKLLYMIFLTFFLFLVFSNIVISISTMFLSEEISLLLATPTRPIHIVHEKFLETMFQSSWMILLVAVPVFLAYLHVLQSPVWLLPLSFLFLLPFFIICTALGLMITVPLARIFPAQRTRNLATFLGVGFVCALFVFFRWLQPERLVRPEEAMKLAQLIAEIQAPTASYLPSTWLADALAALWQQRWGSLITPFLQLLGGALASMGITYWVVNRWFYLGWCHAQEGSVRHLPLRGAPGRVKRQSRVASFGYTGAPEAPRLRSLSPSRVMLFKDVRAFMRDPGQWPQLLLLISIMAVYLINIHHLPFDDMPTTPYAKMLRSLIFFLNSGFTAFIIAAVAARFSFPAVSLEGKSFWIIRTAPLDLRRFVLGKFWIHAVPLVILAELLIAWSCWIMEVDRFMMWLSIGNVFVLTLGVASLAIGLGAQFPRFEVTNNAEIASGWGGLLFMLLSTTYIALILAIEAFPVSRYYFHQLFPQPTDWGYVGLMAAGVLLVTALTCYLPLRFGIASLRRYEP